MEYLFRFRSLARLTGGPIGELRGYWREIATDRAFVTDLATKVESAIQEGRRRETVGAIPTARSNFALYVLARAMKPEKVVETGVGWGVSSAFVLKALEANGKGLLHSIDLPQRNPQGYTYEDGTRDPVALPPEREPGWLVPAELRGRWVLHLGRSTELLPAMLDQEGPIDLFYHDSEHSYETMWFEFEQAWKALRPAGVLAADDIHWNNAFRDFAISVGQQPALLFYRGALRK